MAPQQLLQLLEQIKQSLEPVAMMAMNPAMAQMPGFNAGIINGLFYSSMFKVTRPFATRTAEMLIMRFGNGNLYLSFEQFCLMMCFLNEQKKLFSSVDLDRSGNLDLKQLTAAFAKSGLLLPMDLVIQIGRRYDADGDGVIAFDEYVQMMAEWTQVGMFQRNFSAFGQQRATASDLQQVFGEIRIFYQTVSGGVIPAVRPFSITTCRWLIAMFGTCLPGETFANGVTYEEFLLLVQHVKSVAWQYSQADVCRHGSISAAELHPVLGRMGVPVPPQVLQSVVACYDFDHTGRIEFDEFLQIILELQMNHKRLQSLAVPGLDVSALYTIMYSMPRSVFRDVRVSPTGPMNSGAMETWTNHKRGGEVTTEVMQARQVPLRFS